jgi:hypothetical protein
MALSPEHEQADVSTVINAGEPTVAEVAIAEFSGALAVFMADKTIEHAVAVREKATDARLKSLHEFAELDGTVHPAPLNRFVDELATATAAINIIEIPAKTPDEIKVITRCARTCNITWEAMRLLLHGQHEKALRSMVQYAAELLRAEY